MSTSRSSRLLGAAIAAMLLLAACGDDDGETGAASTTEVPSVSEPSAVGEDVEPADEEDHAHEDHSDQQPPASRESTSFAGVASFEPVPPGRYALASFGGDLVLDAPDGLDVLFVGDGEPITEFLAPGWDESADGLIAMVPVVGIQPPSDVGFHAPHDPVVPQGTTPVPVDLAAWAAAVDQVDIVERDEFETALGTATSFVIEVDPTAGDSFSCPLGDACIGSFVSEQLGVFVLAPTKRFRLFQLSGVPEFVGWVQGGDEQLLAEGSAAMEAVLMALQPA